MLDIKNTTTDAEKKILSATTHTWKSMVQTLIEHYVSIGKPFSSGEISAKIRTFRADLIFSAFTLGEFVRGLFQDGECGLDRFMRFDRYTSLNTLVFVYAPNKWSGDSYDFEVDVPAPNTGTVLCQPGTLQTNLTPPPATVPVWNNGAKPIITATQQSTVVTTGPQDNVEIRVSKDGRLCFTKGLVERIRTETKSITVMKNNPLFFVEDTASTIGIKFVNLYSAVNPKKKTVEADGRLRIPYKGSAALRGTTFSVPFKTLIK